jgi:hypothetical protein
VVSRLQTKPQLLFKVSRSNLNVWVFN